MKLKQKTSLFIVVSFLIFLSIVGLIIRIALLNTYNKIEISFIENNLKLIQNDIEESYKNLNRLLGDWSVWDDTNLFVLGEYPEFIEDNMMDETFINLNLNFIWIGNTSGDQLYSKFINLKNNKEIIFPDSISTYLIKNSYLITKGINKETVEGVVKIDDMAFIFASKAITNSNGDSDPSGIMVMGVLINEQWISNHSNLLNLPFNAHTKLSSSIHKKIVKEIEGIPYLIKNYSPHSYVGYTTIKDIQGENIILIEQTGSRTIYKAGRNSLFWFMGSLTALMIILVIMLRFIAGRFIINRLNYIEMFIGQFKSDKKTDKLFTIKNNDEISNLMNELNDMFNRINESDKHLLEAKEIAEQSNRSKTEFLRNMSHELRTPLNHIIGFSQLIKDGIPGPVNDSQKEYLTDILSSSSHLLSLINELLDLSRIESGKEKLSPEIVNISEIIKESVELFKTKAINTKVQITFKNGKIPETIIADKRKVVQILYNLLSNAVKFSNEEGSIKLSTRTDNTKNEIIISIKDNGIGLEKENMNLIFDSFGQVESDVSRKFDGTGLGLALTKNLVELHGGRIWVESEGLGMGSTFSFTLPLLQPGRN